MKMYGSVFGYYNFTSGNGMNINILKSAIRYNQFAVFV